MTLAKKNKLELQYQIVLRNYMKYEVWSNKLKATRVESYILLNIIYQRLLVKIWINLNNGEKTDHQAVN